MNTRCLFNAPSPPPLAGKRWDCTGPRDRRSRTLCACAVGSALAALRGPRQDGECSGARGSRTRLCLCPSPLCFPPPSIVFLLPLLSLALSPSLPPLMSTAYFRGREGKVLTRRESAHFFPISPHQSASESLSFSASLSLRLSLGLRLSVSVSTSVSESPSLHVSLPLSLPAWLSSPMFPPPPAPV